MLLLDKKITENLYDVIILGGGVAGLAAAITSGQLGLQTLVLEKAVLGGSVAVLESVSDYPGIEKIGGWELTQTMVTQAQKAGCQLPTLFSRNNLIATTVQQKHRAVDISCRFKGLIILIKHQSHQPATNAGVGQ